MEYKYKLLCQFSTTIGGTRSVYGLNRARGTHNRATRSIFFISQNRTERQWLNATWILEKWVLSDFENKLWQTRIFFFKKSSCGLVAMSYK